MYHVTMVVGTQSVKGHIFISDILAIAVVSGTELLWDKHLSLRRPQCIMYTMCIQNLFSLNLTALVIAIQKKTKNKSDYSSNLYIIMTINSASWQQASDLLSVWFIHLTGFSKEWGKCTVCAMNLVI